MIAFNSLKSNELKLCVLNLNVLYCESPARIVRAVNKVSFEVRKGESMGIAGESGSGKSTLGAALMRNLDSTGVIENGSILLDNFDIVNLDEAEFSRVIRWKKISMVFQGAMNTLDPVFTVGKQMQEILASHGAAANFDDIIFGSLDDVGLERTVVKMYPHELSGGMKQRVVIAMSLLLNPEILIADEPTTSVDVLVQAQIIKLLRSLAAKKGITILIISHDLGVIAELVDKVAIMYSGELVELAPAKELFKNPLHPYTQLLISSVPNLASDSLGGSLRGHPPDLANLSDGCNFIDRCPYAMAICRKKPPAVASPNGYVLCWLYE